LTNLTFPTSADSLQPTCLRPDGFKFRGFLILFYTSYRETPHTILASKTKEHTLLNQRLPG